MKSSRLFLLVLALFGLFAMRAEAAVDIAIDVSSQTMRVTTSSGERFVWPVSTARSGYVTPNGVYRPQRLARMHYSRKYNMSPMPHSIFFRGGYAIHGTGAVKQLGRPASHGCIRLAPQNAAKLFSLVKQDGARISISGSPPRSAVYAKSHGKTKVYVASRKRNASALSYAPSDQRSGKSLKRWMQNPALR